MPRRIDITEELLFAGVARLSEHLHKKEVSSLALTEAYLARLEKHGPALGAVVTVTKDLAIAQAKEADRRLQAGEGINPLLGIPFGVKDLLATKGIPTTWGAEPYRKQVFDHDATVVSRLRERGAVLLGKLAMIELAGGFGYNHADASFTGPCRTPWNLKFWSGGSSSGSGAAVAAGLVPFAIGSETSGSIMTPAAYCGVTGLRPTYGRVSRSGAMALCWTLDKLGPMARSADDCALVLSAIAGRDARDPSSSGRAFKDDVAKPRFKLGIVKGSRDRLQKEVLKNFDESMKVLSAFCDIVEDVAYPDLPFGDAVGTIVRAEGAAAFRELLDSGAAKKLRAPSDRWGGYAGTVVTAVDYLQALRLRAPMKKELERVHAKFDAVVAPTRATVAHPIDRDFDKSYRDFGGGPPLIPASNMVGQPAISVPNGFGENGLPTGLMLIGRPWSEPTLLAISRRYQRETKWHAERPKW